MKGFLHVIEIVVVSLVVFALMAQFGSVPPVDTDWSRVKWSLQTQDALFTMDNMGIDWFDTNSVSQNLSSLLSSSGITYKLTLKGAPQSSISVGCACNSSELEMVSDALRQYTLNGENVSFQVFQANDSYSNFTLPLDFDVVVISAQNLSNHSAKVKNFLRAGKGLVSIRDFNSSSVDQTYNAYFGIAWNSSITSSGSQTAFSTHPATEYNALKSYFHSLPVQYDEFSGSVQANWTTSGSWSWASGSYSADTGLNGYASAYGGPVLSNFTVRANVTVETVYGPPASAWGGVSLRYDNVTQHRYILYINAAGSANLVNATGQNDVLVQTVATGLSAGPHILELAANGSELKAFVDGSFRYNSTGWVDSPGQMAIEANSSKSRFDDVRMTLSDYLEQPMLSGESVQPTFNDYERAIITEPLSSAAAMVAKDKAADFKGRSVWISSPGQLDTRFKNLVRAAVTWAAGSDYVAIDDASAEPFAKVSIYRVFTKDMYQPVEIVMEISPSF